MFSAWTRATRARTLRTGLAFICPLLGFLGCAGGNSNTIPPPGNTPPSAPTLSAPVTGTVGFPVTASVQGASSTLVYTWTLSPTTAFFKGGSATASGPSVTFTSNVPGTFTLSCVATAGIALSSAPATATVAITPPSAAAGSFQPAGNLLTARWGLAAAVLPNGTILVTGGSSDGTLANALKSTEIYDPAGKASVAGPSMNTARLNHALTALPGTGTQFLITGGGSITRTPTNPNPNGEIYDSSLNAFSVPASAMATDRSYHTATPIISPGGVFIAGGLSNAGVQVNNEELYSVNPQTFASAGTVPLAPYHTATLLTDGKILLVSHMGSGSNWVPFATVYDPATGTCTPPANQPSVGREGHQAILLNSRNPPSVLILGGSNGSGPVASAEWYNPVTRTFSPVAASMASPREDFGVGLLAGGKVLLVGGSADGTSALATAEIFDPAAATFTPTSSMGTPRIAPSVFQLPGGRVVVLGGTSGGAGATTAVETFPN